MDLHHIQTFLTAAETSSYRETARRRGISQPAVSQQIHSIEGELGLLLFRRKGRGVELTEAGQVLRESFRAIHLRGEELFRLTGMLRRHELGHIVIGYSTSLMFEAQLPEILRQFSEVHPSVELQIDPMRVHDAIEALTERRIDLAIMRGPLPVLPPDLESFVFSRSRLRLAVPKRHPFAQLKKVEIADLAVQTLLTMRDPAGVGLRQVTETWLSEAMVNPAAIRLIPDMTALMGMVAAGVGIAILPEDIAAAHAGVASVQLGSETRYCEGMVIAPRTVAAIPLRHLLKRLNAAL